MIGLANSSHAIPGMLAGAPLGARLAPAPAASGVPAADRFGRAVVLGGSPPPSVLAIYDAQGRSSTDTAPGPNPTLLPPSLDASHADVPFRILYARLGNTIQQIQLAERNGSITNRYAIGLRLLV